MYFQFTAAISDLSLPVTSDMTDNMDMYSELNELGNLDGVIGMSTLPCPQVNVQCTSNLVVAILDLWLPVTSDSTDNMIDMSSELNDLENIKVVFES